jgi:hypothetical protein
MGFLTFWRKQMGFFSWKTCDTNESIPAFASGRAGKPVYLLQPNGLPPIVEECYEGYGEFGGVDAYVWLAKANAPHWRIDLSGMDEEEIRRVGISLDVGTVMIDTEKKQIWSIFSDARAIVGGSFFAGNYGEVIPELGDTANNLASSGRFKSVYVKDIVDLAYPLKFSFDPKAVYEEHEASANCEHQGYFYED